ncbi:MAG: IreB family regulatory phosphoprotein [Armatimonadota bacterium]|nr:IreB family regulatory phosphoprotein [Armatimonadota bacterium]MDR5675187.1 IreB family regulatory phosphoprotein [Armatimonadota bacterium]MDR5689939.1 IreB family regulatory phosphoprotein [Armatimonadota bacterium]MDR7387892.1 IreB family regulatory phosphoprotein [Armatimonadota bacterium]MDR7389754.1 IreB family regulatory phosphoprotein [Armatimonadota bacterium]
MSESHEQTGVYRLGEELPGVFEILLEVYRALQERGYSPKDQLVGYLISGDPTYITSHRGARSLIRKVDRDRILEELVRFYVEKRIRPALEG